MAECHETDVEGNSWVSIDVSGCCIEHVHDLEGCLILALVSAMIL